ncbi:hypothetical protein PR048_029691 [Dryococelus australis]|uniref:Uncharacterized protein n=1 Tax=Dryococelus australis TaxID=614101 RepID=A0ABQ9GE30_9NEOP|nr:hypothetical protein PR048_029691 [Dryococelus australis]
MQGWGKQEIPEKTRRPAASSGRTTTCENPGVTRPGIETDSPWWEACSLTAQPPWPPYPHIIMYHPSELGWIPGGVCSLIFASGNRGREDAAGRRVVSGISRFPRCYILALLLTHLTTLASQYLDGLRKGGCNLLGEVAGCTRCMCTLHGRLQLSFSKARQGKAWLLGDIFFRGECYLQLVPPPRRGSSCRPHGTVGWNSVDEAGGSNRRSRHSLLLSDEEARKRKYDCCLAIIIHPLVHKRYLETRYVLCRLSPVTEVQLHFQKTDVIRIRVRSRFRVRLPLRTCCNRLSDKRRADAICNLSLLCGGLSVSSGMKNHLTSLHACVQVIDGLTPETVSSPEKCARGSWSTNHLDPPPRLDVFELLKRARCQPANHRRSVLEYRSSDCPSLNPTMSSDKDTLLPSHTCSREFTLPGHSGLPGIVATGCPSYSSCVMACSGRPSNEGLFTLSECFHHPSWRVTSVQQRGLVDASLSPQSSRLRFPAVDAQLCYTLFTPFEKAVVGRGDRAFVRRHISQQCGVILHQGGQSVRVVVRGGPALCRHTRLPRCQAGVDVLLGRRGKKGKVMEEAPCPAKNILCVGLTYFSYTRNDFDTPTDVSFSLLSRCSENSLARHFDVIRSSDGTSHQVFKAIHNSRLSTQMHGVDYIAQLTWPRRFLVPSRADSEGRANSRSDYSKISNCPRTGETRVLTALSRHAWVAGELIASQAYALRLRGKEIMQGDMQRDREGLGSNGQRLGP